MSVLAERETDEVTRLRAAIGTVARRLRPTDAGEGLTPTQMSVLRSVVRHGPLRAGALAELEGLNPTMLSRVVAILGDRGLVRRVPDPVDRRAAVLEVTTAGRRLRERMRRERNAKLAPMLDALPSDQHAALVAALPALENLAELLAGRSPA